MTMGKVVDLLPASTVMVGGTDASASELDVSLSLSPPIGAALLSVTLPVAVLPPNAGFGETDRFETC